MKSPITSLSKILLSCWIIFAIALHPSASCAGATATATALLQPGADGAFGFSFYGQSAIQGDYCLYAGEYYINLSPPIPSDTCVGASVYFVNSDRWCWGPCVSAGT